MSKKHRRKCKNCAYRRTKNVHHVFGQARFPQLRNANWNQQEINAYKHDLFHFLFRDRTPLEVIDFLQNYFWGGRTAQQMEMLAEAFQKGGIQ